VEGEEEGEFFLGLSPPGILIVLRPCQLSKLKILIENWCED
tara:strand:- start:2757 stop:2879 length:123 start_codon:yes stop_codon:yes gene_type:complete